MGQLTPCGWNKRGFEYRLMRLAWHFSREYFEVHIFRRSKVEVVNSKRGLFSLTLSRDVQRSPRVLVVIIESAIPRCKACAGREMDSYLEIMGSSRGHSAVPGVRRVQGER